MLSFPAIFGCCLSGVEQSIQDGDEVAVVELGPSIVFARSESEDGEELINPIDVRLETDEPEAVSPVLPMSRRAELPGNVEGHAVDEESEEGEDEGAWTPGSACSMATTSSRVSRRGIKLEKGSMSLNIRFDSTSSGIQILDIKGGGALEKHNSDASEDERIHTNDFLRAINGATSPLVMLDRIKSDPVLEIDILRPEPYQVRITRVNQTWGLNLTYQNISAHIEIVEVIDGAVKEHNRTAPDELQVRPGDFIESVNGITTVEKMMQCMKSSETVLDLKMLRLS